MCRDCNTWYYLPQYPNLWNASHCIDPCLIYKCPKYSKCDTLLSTTEDPVIRCTCQVANLCMVIQCSWSGSRIRCFFDPWIRDSGLDFSRKLDPHPIILIDFWVKKRYFCVNWLKFYLYLFKNKIIFYCIL